MDQNRQEKIGCGTQLFERVTEAIEKCYVDCENIETLCHDNKFIDYLYYDLGSSLVNIATYGDYKVDFKKSKRIDKQIKLESDLQGTLLEVIDEMLLPIFSEPVSKMQASDPKLGLLYNKMVNILEKFLNIIAIVNEGRWAWKENKK